jgi:N-acyl homoserine lactone hydrolase
VRSLTYRSILGFFLFLFAGPAVADPVTSVRLYALECGHIDFKDMGFFSDTGEYDGKPGSVVATCFVIQHPKGVLVWDTGLPDKIGATKGGIDPIPGIHMTVENTMESQLQAIGIKPADVTFVAFSHLHFDHTGNANAFGSATWIMNKAEIAWATTTPPPPPVMPDSFSAYKTAKTQMIDGDYDVFGDGTVRILKTPGHTPGHQALLVKLKKSGVVVLSGDLYHFRENRKNSRVPMVNTERADTLASMQRIEKIVANTKARFIIQHDAQDFKALPKAPAFLE